MSDEKEKQQINVFKAAYETRIKDLLGKSFGISPGDIIITYKKTEMKWATKLGIQVDYNSLYVQLIDNFVKWIEITLGDDVEELLKMKDEFMNKGLDLLAKAMDMIISEKR
jgi:hypothetical protein